MRTKLDKLITQCKKHPNLQFRSITVNKDRYIVTAHDKSLAGREPVFEESRDYLDYQYAMDSWVRKGLVILSEHENPNRAIELAIEYLEQC